MFEHPGSPAPIRFLRFRAPTVILAGVLFLVLCLPAPGTAKEAPTGPRLSSMGALVAGKVPLPSWLDSVLHPTRLVPLSTTAGGTGGSARLAPGEVNVTPGASRFQSETTIAARGDTVVVGFNDAAGFFNPDGVSVSGFAYSHDGGQTFTYGGQLPKADDDDAVYGDPDVKVWVDPATDSAVFVYSSIYRTSDGKNSLCIHVSTDGGVTWDGPRNVTTVESDSLFADKEFLNVDPETGRVMLSWTSFGSTVTMRTVYSDDLGLTWSAPVTFSSRPEDGQGSCPRFDPTSDKAYIVWKAYGSPGAISFVRSLDNGTTWSSPADVATGVVDPLPPFGSDRINGFPSLAVSPVDGSLHMVYVSNQSADFGDVYYTASADSGDTWTTPVVLNSDPGNDRCQFFSWISIGEDGGLDVVWYDQSVGTEGSDLTQMMHVHSEDGGNTWSCPAPLTAQPFHAEYGQDTGQPNIGDYNQCFSQVVGATRMVYVSYARNDEADYQTNAPDTYVAVRDTQVPRVSLPLGGVTVDDIGCTDDGVLVASEGAELSVVLDNGCASGLTDLFGTLSTTTPGVTLLNFTSAFADAGGGGATQNTDVLRLNMDEAYPCGERVDFRLTGDSDQGSFLVDFSLPTGVVVQDSLLLSENFDATPVGSLPAGWVHSQLKGVNNPWQVKSDYASSGSRSVACADYPDTNWSRLSSPAIAVPSNADLVEVTFSVTYDNEDVGNGRQAYDGALLKIEVDGSWKLAGSFSTLFEGQYRTQIVRSSGSLANPLQDLSAWSGNTLPDFEAIRIQYPGLGGHTIKLFFEMGSDGSVGGTGTFVDDITVRALDLDCGTCTSTTGVTGLPEHPARLFLGPVTPNPLHARGEITFALPSDGPVWATVYDMAGRRVRRFYNGESLPAGPHTVAWDGNDDGGAPAASGIYFVRVRTASETRTVKAVLMR